MTYSKKNTKGTCVMHQNIRRKHDTPFYMYSDQFECFTLRCDAMRLHLFSFAILYLFCFFIRRNRTPFVFFCFFFRKLLQISKTEFIDCKFFCFLRIQLAFGSLHLWFQCQSFSVPNEKNSSAINGKFACRICGLMPFKCM